MNDEFLFREDYTEEEMIDRIHSDYFDWEIPLVQRNAVEAGLSEDDLGNKTDTILKLKSRLDMDKYDDFLQQLFNKYGKRGQKFNFRLYKVSDSIETSQLLSNAENYEETWLEGLDTVRDIQLKRVNKQNEDTTDFLFFVEGAPETDPAEEYRVKQDGEDKDLVDIEGIDNQSILQKSNDYHLEARYYPTYDLVGISNAEGPDGVRDSLISKIEEWGKGNE